MLIDNLSVHLCYASDLCLTSGMQELLNICQYYATNHQLLYTCTSANHFFMLKKQHH